MNKVDAPQGYAAGRDLQSNAAPSVSIDTISGGNNIIGNHGPVNVHYITAPKRANRPRPPLPASDAKLITSQQKAALTALRDEWMALHAAIKKKPLSFSAAWSSINHSVGVASYHEIPAEQFDQAVAYVRKQMAILRNMKSAPSKDVMWRNSRIGAIKTRSKNQLKNPDAYKAYIKKNFQADSLTDLSTDELQRTYSYIMAKK